MPNWNQWYTWIDNLNRNDRRIAIAFGKACFDSVQTEEQFKIELRKRIEEHNKIAKENFAKQLSGNLLRTFNKLGGTSWEGYINAETKDEFWLELHKYEYVYSLDPETKKQFDSLGGFEWKEFKRASNHFEVKEALAFVDKETEWPSWIERLDPHQREMFDHLGGVEWKGFKEEPYEHSFRFRLDAEIKKREAEGWIERLSYQDRCWFEALGDVDWAGYDESDTEEEFVAAIHSVIEETDSVMKSIAEAYPLACEQCVKLKHSGLNEAQLEYALEAIEDQVLQERKEGKDLLFLLERKPNFNELSTFTFHVMERDDFVKSFGIDESTYTDFVNSDRCLDDIYETRSVKEICEYANIELEMGTMSKEDYNDFRNELEKVLSQYPKLRDE